MLAVLMGSTALPFEALSLALNSRGKPYCLERQALEEHCML